MGGVGHLLCGLSFSAQSPRFPEETRRLRAPGKGALMAHVLSGLGCFIGGPKVADQRTDCPSHWDSKVKRSSDLKTETPRRKHTWLSGSADRAVPAFVHGRTGGAYIGTLLGQMSTGGTCVALTTLLGPHAI